MNRGKPTQPTRTVGMKFHAESKTTETQKKQSESATSASLGHSGSANSENTASSPKRVNKQKTPEAAKLQPPTKSRMELDNHL